MPWYFYLAIKQLFPSGKICSFFALVSILGVTLGVMVLVIVQSVMNGFGEEIRRKIIDVNGHVRIESGQVFRAQPSLLEQVAQLHGVEATQTYAQGVVMVVHEQRPSFPFIRGMEVLEAEDMVTPLHSYILMGTLEDLDDESIVLSSGLAAQLGAGVGSTIEVYSPLMLERLKADEVLLPRELRVVALFEAGWNQVDSNTMIGTLRLMQDLYGLEDGVHGIALRLEQDDRVEAVMKALQTQLQPPLRAFTWLESNRDLIFVLRLEKTMMFFIILFIILVSSFSIASSLLTTVVRKTREIGLIGALGGRPWQLASLYCLQGLIIGVSGTLLGIGGSLLALAYRNEIVHTFARLTQSEAALLHFYQFSDIPVHYARSDFVVISIFAICISTCAGLIPAWRASRLKPSEALRNDY